MLKSLPPFPSPPPFPTHTSHPSPLPLYRPPPPPYTHTSYPCPAPPHTATDPSLHTCPHSHAQAGPSKGINNHPNTLVPPCINPQPWMARYLAGRKPCPAGPRPLLQVPGPGPSRWLDPLLACAPAGATAPRQLGDRRSPPVLVGQPPQQDAPPLLTHPSILQQVRAPTPQSNNSDPPPPPLPLPPTL